MICLRHRRPLLFSAALLVAVIIVVLVLVIPRFFLARATDTISGTAPNNNQWTPSTWASSDNTLLGTAQNTSSDVWFTGSDGTIGEVFYPTADTPNTTKLQFLIENSNHTWVNQESNDTVSNVHLYNNHSLAWVTTNTAKNGDYQFTKIVYTDPARNSVIQQVTFKALRGHLADYQLYVYYDPTIHDKGDNNNSYTKVYQDRTMLVSTSGAGKYASALAASLPYQTGMISSGFKGQSDGWSDLTAGLAAGAVPARTT